MENYLKKYSTIFLHTSFIIILVGTLGFPGSSYARGFFKDLQNVGKNAKAEIKRVDKKVKRELENGKNWWLLGQRL